MNDLDWAGHRYCGLAIEAIEAIGQVKQASTPPGVKRHYLGCAGKVPNGITTVHLTALTLECRREECVVISG